MIIKQTTRKTRRKEKWKNVAYQVVTTRHMIIVENVASQRVSGMEKKQGDTSFATNVEATHSERKRSRMGWLACAYTNNLYTQCL